MDERPSESWRARAAVSEALDVFNSIYMQEVWTKALARRETDPEGAVTTARTLLESVCKHILDSANREFREGAPLPQLYAETAKALEMAPSQELAPIFNSLFKACAEVIEGIGRLRNELSDSHGRGPFGTMPHWRHAELAVNLSGAMTTYLAAIWKGRQPTVADVLRIYLDKQPPHKSSSYVLERMARDMKDLVAAKLRPSDLVMYFEERAAAGAKPASIQKEFAMLRAALAGNSASAIALAAAILRREKRMTNVHIPQYRRVSRSDCDAVLNYLREQAKFAKEARHKGTALGSVDVVEFAIWSGRTLADLFKLRWSEVDFEKRCCRLPGQQKSFPVLERAWEIIEKRRSNSVESGRIFPYDPQMVTLRHMMAVRALVKAGTIQRPVRFHDYRYEAVHRLLEIGHSAQIVAMATGQAAGKILKIASAVQTVS